MGFAESLLRDLRQGFRIAARTPLISGATIATLALGIGLNAGVFSILNGLLFRPRVQVEPATFVHLSPEYRGSHVPEGQSLPSFSEADFDAVRSGARTLRSLAAWSVTHTNVDRSTDTSLVLLVSCSFFDVYGLPAAEIGRLFRADECAQRDAHRVLVISDELWHRRYDADPAIVGRTIDLGGYAFVVIGVTPPQFAGRLRGPGLWVPFTEQTPFFRNVKDLERPETAWLNADGRLADHTARHAVEAELNVLMARQDRLLPGRHTAVRVTDGSLIEEPAVRREAFWIVPLVMGTLSLVLLIAALNVAALLLSRAAARRREVAIRIALGASAAQVVRMLMVESVVLAACAVPAAAYLAFQVPRVFRSLIAGLPYYPLEPNRNVFLFLGAATIAAGCIAGLAPAMESMRQRVSASLADGEPVVGARGRWTTRDSLITLQLALSLVLLLGVALFARAEQALGSVRDLDPSRLIVVALQTRPADQQEIADRVRALPHVQSVALTTALPMIGEEVGPELEVRAVDLPASESVSVENTSVSPEFFATAGLSVLRGRSFERGDEWSSPAPVLLSESAAEVLKIQSGEISPPRVGASPGPPRAGDPLGAELEDSHGKRYLVVGIAKDTRAFAAAQPHVYSVLRAATADQGVRLLARTDVDGVRVVPAVQKIVNDVTRAASAQAETLESLLGELAARFNVFVEMLAFLGAVAIVLSVIGIYGVVAFTVGRRTREFGIRVALGATRRNIIGLVFASGARPLVSGIAAGLILAAGPAIALQRQFAHTPVPLDVRDPVAYGAVIALLVAVAFAAMYVPARRSARSNPAVALREG